MKRILATLFVALLCCASNAFACRSSQGNTTRDVTFYKQSLNGDLADYGTIFEEAAPWSGCTQVAADALYKKLYTTFHPETLGFNSWQTGVYDGNVDLTLHAPFQGWLSGGNVALIHATALRLANVGKLTKPLDDLIRQINYVRNKDAHCGWDNFWNKDQNSCMEEYAIGAMGYAWIAAYRAKRNVGLDVATPLGLARADVDSTLSTDDESLCAWPNITYSSTAPPSPCSGNIEDLAYWGYTPISFHTGDSIPYGFGLLTSVASASVAVKLADPNSTTPFLDDIQKAVVQRLYNHSRARTTYDGTTNPVTFNWKSDCNTFTKQTDGSMVVTPNNYCGANTPLNGPKMFPVSAFINAYAPPVASTQPKFDTFDPNLFCDGTGYCEFFSAGRRAVYGQMAHDWVVNPPVFSNTGLGDYTATFQTYDGHYLSARNGGGSDINAEATSIGNNERFSVYIRSSSSQLSHGDTITIQSLGTQKAQWVAAEDGGGPGSTMNATRIWPGPYEMFVIHKLNGTGVINNGDPVALTSVDGFYVSATNGGGSTVLADKTAAITWERFVIGLTHN